jgi:hypothetical protein
VGREAIANFSRAELADDCSGIFWILEGILSEESEVEAGLRKSDSCAKALDTPRDLVGAKFCRTVGNDGSCSVSENDWTTGWFTGVVPSATDSVVAGGDGVARASLSRVTGGVCAVGRELIGKFSSTE